MPISEKQRKILAFPFTQYDALICDGAIRSGKTSLMMVAFVDDAMRRYNNQRFGICGKTVGSTIENIIAPYLALSYAKQRYSLKWKRADKQLIVTDGTHRNIFEIFGGKDESSFMLIQGRTLAGVLMDEVALQPRSFVEQALARCSVDGSKWWFNCNPGSPQHWFYKEWIQQPAAHNALYLHFELEDNPSLSERIIQRYKSMYTGVFYRRYILGEWCVAEGLVYPNFDSAQHVISSVPHTGADRFYISIDYGTHNPCSMGLWRVDPIKHKAYREREYYYSSKAHGSQQKTDEEYYSALEELVGNYPITKIIVDPSAASFIETIRRHNRFTVEGATNDVNDGIRVVSTLLASSMIQLHFSCRDSIREFGLYSWDDKKNDDTVIKENDHAMDDIRYFCNTILRRQFRWVDWR